MNPIEQAILDLLANEPSPIRPLAARYPRASVYDALRRLRDSGRVVPGSSPGTWTLAPSARCMTVATGAPPWVWPAVLDPYLELMPSDVHRAVAILVILSHLVRLVYERHHASYVLYSHQGLRGKSWLMSAIAYMLGVGAGSLVHAGVETRGSLGVRRRSTGEVAQVRAALGTALLGIDERGRASDKGVQSVIDLLIHGSRSIPLEGGMLDVMAVVMIATNCEREGMEVQEATHLDPPMQRRCHIACLDAVVLDPRFAEEGEARLAQIQRLGPVPLPTPGRMDCEPEVGRMISAALPGIVDSPERLGGIDLALLRQQAVAATWLGLSPSDAVALVLRSSALLMATLGRTGAAWEARLATATDQRSPEESPDAEPEEAPAPDFGLELDYQARLSELDRVAREHGAGDPEVLDRRLTLASAVAKTGLRAEDLAGLVELLRIVRGGDGRPTERLRVLVTMDEAEVSPEEAVRLLALVPSGRSTLGLGPEDLELVVRGIEEAGLDPAEVGAWAAWSMRQLDRIDGEIDEAKDELKDWRRKGQEAAEQLMTLNLRVAKLSKILERAERDPGLARALKLADTECEREVLAQVMRAVAEIGETP